MWLDCALDSHPIISAYSSRQGLTETYPLVKLWPVLKGQIRSSDGQELSRNSSLASVTMRILHLRLARLHGSLPFLAKFTPAAWLFSEWGFGESL